MRQFIQEILALQSYTTRKDHLESDENTMLFYHRRMMQLLYDFVIISTYLAKPQHFVFKFTLGQKARIYVMLEKHSL